VVAVYLGQISTNSNAPDVFTSRNVGTERSGVCARDPREEALCSNGTWSNSRFQIGHHASS
jgi:hypothetical protein